MIRGEYLPGSNPPEVRFTGDPQTMGFLSDGLKVMHAASTRAATSGQPFICAPQETEQAQAEWELSLCQRNPEVRRVSARSAELAYRGLVRVHANLEEAAATYGADAADPVHTHRMHRLANTLIDLTELKTRLTETGHFPAE